jgi:hypothetical protein
MADPEKIPLLNSKGATPPPPAAVKHPNWFINFFENVGHVLGDVFKWGPTVAKDTITVIEDTKELEPAFKAALTPILEDVATIAGQASLSVAQKGLNPLQDIATIQALEKLVKDFGTFYPVLQNAINTIKGVIVPPPAVVAAEAKKEETAPLPITSDEVFSQEKEDKILKGTVSVVEGTPTTPNPTPFVPKIPTPAA